MKPIPFNTEMVRAILEGRKTTTRRVIKPQPRFIYANDNYGPLMQITKPHKGVWFNGDPNHVAPYQAGDILYVRETWCWCPCWDCGGLSEDGTMCQEDGIERVYSAKYGDYGCFCYRASCMDNEVPSADVWHPSIHMPREAARIFLRVTGVLVERVQEIDEAQARAEGARPTVGIVKFPENKPVVLRSTAVDDFSRIWDSTIKPKDRDRYGWSADPWVWVIEFERISKEEAK